MVATNGVGVAVVSVGGVPVAPDRTATVAEIPMTLTVVSPGMVLIPVFCVDAGIRAIPVNDTSTGFPSTTGPSGATSKV
jgi:hypothetical protein